MIVSSDCVITSVPLRVMSSPENMDPGYNSEGPRCTPIPVYQIWNINQVHPRLRARWNVVFLGRTHWQARDNYGDHQAMLKAFTNFDALKVLPRGRAFSGCLLEMAV